MVYSSSVNQSHFNFSQIMNITPESEDLEASEVELSTVGAATAVAPSEPVIVVDDTKAEDDIIFQLDTTQGNAFKLWY